MTSLCDSARRWQHVLYLLEGASEEESVTLGHTWGGLWM